MEMKEFIKGFTKAFTHVEFDNADQPNFKGWNEGSAFHVIYDIDDELYEVHDDYGFEMCVACLSDALDWIKDNEPKGENV